MQRLLVSRSLRRYFRRLRCASPLQAPSPALLARKRSVTDGNPRGRLFDALWLHRVARRPHPSAACGHRRPQRDRHRRDRRHPGRGRSHRAAQHLRPARHRPAVHPQRRRRLRRRADRRRVPLHPRQPADADRRRQRSAQPAVRLHLLRPQPDRSRSSTRTATSPSRAATTPAPSATSRACSTGPPRVAPFLADLDPSTGGRVLANAAADGYTVTWCNVRGFDSAQTTNVQLTLLPERHDRDEVRRRSRSTTPSSDCRPAAPRDFRPVNLSADGTDCRRVRRRRRAVRRRGPARHRRGGAEVLPQPCRQLRPADLLDRRSRSSTTPSPTRRTVANEVRGIGLEIFDQSAATSAAPAASAASR